MMLSVLLDASVDLLSEAPGLVCASAAHEMKRLKAETKNNFLNIYPFSKTYRRGRD
jgi:hypothetical protein